MSASSDDQLAQRNGRTRLKRAPAGKPTHRNDPMHSPLYYETTERLFKSSVRNVSHRNKTSAFDSVGDESRDSNRRSTDKWTNKKIIAPPPGEIKEILQQEPFHTMSKRHGRRIHQEVAHGNIFSRQSSKKTSSYSLNNNPYRWGVDVLRYPLPPPKRNYRHAGNLSVRRGGPRLGGHWSEAALSLRCSPIVLLSHRVALPSCCSPIVLLSHHAALPPCRFLPSDLPRAEQKRRYINCIPKDLERSETKPACTLRRDNLNVKIEKGPLPLVGLVPVLAHPTEGTYLTAESAQGADLTPIEHVGRRPFHVNTTCRNKQCSVAFNSAREPSPFRSGKRIGYISAKREHSVFLC
ncbi:hypothetical protein PCYB_032670 [Plasmodium cynomolgi strain B]|uniref:Uncharacterized protein n=1 Tax=Plasmodium cynomolgi (strain B) TaxID=1120755 RepID=K6UCH4_PLACD|nr:hypothetical protein PCYB_032670 [Plasmodium cynomolgi strain B]GAB64856.1 hypothetical protein PCYB_032670 [Plasmodium cynomolgi strain B]